MERTEKGRERNTGRYIENPPGSVIIAFIRTVCGTDTGNSLRGKVGTSGWISCDSKANACGDGIDVSGV